MKELDGIIDDFLVTGLETGRPEEEEEFICFRCLTYESHGNTN
jgi:hypothetical protein